MGILAFFDVHNLYVRMAERSKAPDSRVELFLTGVFWSTNVGVGSNPPSDKIFCSFLFLKIVQRGKIAATWDLTRDLQIFSLTPSQLSYRGTVINVGASQCIKYRSRFR